MCIDFSGFDAGVAQGLLEAPEVHAGFEQMGCKAMAKHMGGDWPLNTGALGGVLDYHLHTSVAIRFANILPFKQPGHRPGHFEILPQAIQ